LRRAVRPGRAEDGPDPTAAPPAPPRPPPSPAPALELRVHPLAQLGHDPRVLVVEALAVLPRVAELLLYLPQRPQRAHLLGADQPLARVDVLVEPPDDRLVQRVAARRRDQVRHLQPRLAERHGLAVAELPRAPRQRDRV